MFSLTKGGNYLNSASGIFLLKFTLVIPACPNTGKKCSKARTCVPPKYRRTFPLKRVTRLRPATRAAPRHRPSLCAGVLLPRLAPRPPRPIREPRNHSFCARPGCSRCCSAHLRCQRSLVTATSRAITSDYDVRS
jgi:hypothetical protein